MMSSLFSAGQCTIHNIVNDILPRAENWPPRSALPAVASAAAAGTATLLLAPLRSERLAKSVGTASFGCRETSWRVDFGCCTGHGAVAAE
jgi:hypothetical protein